MICEVCAKAPQTSANPIGEIASANFSSGVSAQERFDMLERMEDGRDCRKGKIWERAYNCAQAVLCAFAPDLGLTHEQAFAVSANFGSGMKMAATCGAVTGGLMVLGMYGIEDAPTIGAFLRAVRDNHSGCLNCGDLLRMNKEAGGKKKPHCDGMVYEAVELVEKILDERK